jgi:hypothetical protein
VGLERVQAVEIDADVVVAGVVEGRIVVHVSVKFHREHVVGGLPIVLRIADGAQTGARSALCDVVDAEEEHESISTVGAV